MSDPGADPDLHDHPHPTAPRSRPYVLRVGLTGGIATGKSTVARIFQTLGATVLDADAIAHRMIQLDAPAYRSVVDAFGPEILREDGGIDRGALGRIIFSNPDKRTRLESILHPLIRKEEATLVATLTAIGQGRIAVTNAALLIETGAYRDYQRLVVTHCAPDVQTERVMQRDGLSPEEARARIYSQMSTEEKLQVTHYAIDTSHGFASTETLSRTVFRHLQLDLQALSEAT
jgi:dephospho-CoA kinase